MTSATKKFSKDLNIDGNLTTDGADSELSLVDDTHDFLDVFSGTLTFGEQHRNASLDFGKMSFQIITFFHVWLTVISN